MQLAFSQDEKSMRWSMIYRKKLKISKTHFAWWICKHNKSWNVKGERELAKLSTILFVGIISNVHLIFRAIWWKKKREFKLCWQSKRKSIFFSKNNILLSLMFSFHIMNIWINSFEMIFKHLYVNLIKVQIFIFRY